MLSLDPAVVLPLLGGAHLRSAVLALVRAAGMASLAAGIAGVE